MNYSSFLFQSSFAYMSLKGVRKDISIASGTQQLPTQEYVLFGEGEGKGKEKGKGKGRGRRKGRGREEELAP